VPHVTDTRADDELSVVSWVDPYGFVVEGCPLPVAHAEALAQAYASQDPRGRYWTHRVPWLKAPRGTRPRRCD